MTVDSLLAATHKRSRKEQRHTIEVELAIFEDQYHVFRVHLGIGIIVSLHRSVLCDSSLIFGGPPSDVLWQWWKCKQNDKAPRDRDNPSGAH